MNESTVRIGAERLLVVLAVLFLPITFLDWHEGSVAVGGVVDVHGHSMAWNGWGAIAGVAVVGLLILEWDRYLDGQIARKIRAEVVAAALSLAIFVFTLVEFFAGSASLQVGSLVQVDVVRLWPAYVGLGLAVLIGIAGIAQLGPPRERRRGRLRPRMP